MTIDSTTMKSIATDIIAIGTALTAILAALTAVAPTIHMSLADQSIIVAASAVIGAIVLQVRNFTQMTLFVNAAAKQEAAKQGASK